MSVPGLLIDPEVVRECGPAVVLWSPACRQPVGPASGASQWDQPVGPASGASQGGYLWASSSVGSSELSDAGGF